MIRAVVTDMDNTLYSWVDYIVPSLEAMVDSLCRTTGWPRIKVVQALKEVYERYESNEYPFAIQESKLYAEFGYDFDSFNKLIIAPARDAFSAARRKYLQPYPRVVSTLEQLKARGVPVVALTDAPRNPAERRAKKMKLDGLLTAIYALTAFPFPDTGIDPDILARERAGGISLECPVYELPREFEKPHPGGFERICRDLGVEPHEVALVGDSLTKEMRIARESGALGCWAEYGTYVSAEYQERLSIISAPSATRRHLRHSFDKEHGFPPVRLSGFDQVLEVVQSAQARQSQVA